MAVAFVGSSTANFSGSGITFTDPGGGAGNLLIVCISTNTATASWTAPDGTWTQIFNVSSTTFDSETWQIFYKKSGVGSGTYLFTDGGGVGAGGGIIAAWSGHDNVSTLDGTPASTLNNTGVTNPWTPITAPGITTTNDNSLVIWIGAVDTNAFMNGGVTQTPPSGFTARAVMNTSDLTGAFGISDKTQAVAGASGTASGTLTDGGASTVQAARIGFSIGIKSGAPATPSTIAWITA